MKKILLLCTAILLSTMGWSQSQNTFMSAVTATASATFKATPATSPTPGNNSGSIAISTSSTFNGTTSTIALYASNNGVTYFPVYASDGVTLMQYTLTTSFNKPFNLLGLNYGWYELVYTKGDASAGTISATILTR